jgi:uncharacterized protein YkwD
MIDLELLISLHNRYRKSLGIEQSLYKDDYLTKYSQKHSNWMSDNNRLIHSDIREILKSGYKQVAENIAFGQKTEEEVFNKWVKSFRHRRNIINVKYNKIGCSFSEFNKKKYWTVVFASD